MNYKIGTVDVVVFFFKQKTAYEMRISDWSADVCSSDLARRANAGHVGVLPGLGIPDRRLRAGARNPPLALRTDAPLHQGEPDAARIHRCERDRKSVE